jgi:hypothetical protein
MGCFDGVRSPSIVNVRKSKESWPDWGFGWFAASREYQNRPPNCAGAARHVPGHEPNPIAISSYRPLKSRGPVERRAHPGSRMT